MYQPKAKSRTILGELQNALGRPIVPVEGDDSNDRRRIVDPFSKARSWCRCVHGGIPVDQLNPGFAEPHPGPYSCSSSGLKERFLGAASATMNKAPGEALRARARWRCVKSVIRASSYFAASARWAAATP